MNMNNPVKMTRDMVEDGRNTIARDLKQVVSDAGTLLEQVSSATSEEFAAARSRMEDSLHEMQAAIAKGSRHAVRNTEEYVRHNPWKTAGAVALLGIIIGIMSFRRH